MRRDETRRDNPRARGVTGDAVLDGWRAGEMDAVRSINQANQCCPRGHVGDTTCRSPVYTFRPSLGCSGPGARQDPEDPGIRPPTAPTGHCRAAGASQARLSPGAVRVRYRRP